MHLEIQHGPAIKKRHLQQIETLRKPITSGYVPPAPLGAQTPRGQTEKQKNIANKSRPWVCSLGGAYFQRRPGAEASVATMIYDIYLQSYV